MKRVQYTISIFCGCLLFSLAVSAAELGGDYGSLLCPYSLDIPARPELEKALETDAIHIVADEADLVEEGVSTLTGNAEITRNTQQATADYIEYDRPNDIAELDGNVNYWDEALYLRSKAALLKLDNGVGEFNDTDYTIIDSRGRGNAEKLVLDIGTRTDMERVRYTTCDPEDEFWRFSASTISLDHENDRGSARNVVIRIKNIPVFYTPYMSFPLNRERKTGFLAPGYGNTNRHGLELRTPYYWNISPNMDATLAPRLLTDSGVMAVGEYRFLHGSGSGIINAEYLPSDNQRHDNHRNSVGIELKQRFAGSGNLQIDYHRVSDKFYFEDFGRQLSTTSTRFLDQRGEIAYRGQNWNVMTRVQNYQTVDRSIAVTSRPYKRLPQFLFHYAAPGKYGQLNYGFGTEIVNFSRGDDAAFTDNVNGLRVNLRPYISFPMRTVATYIEPKLSLDYTHYQLNDSTLYNDNTPDRLLPVFSLDGGIFLERETRLFDTPYRQTLEPRIFYLYVPHENQSDLPVFDTGLLTNAFATLFRENRFSGGDRYGDANQITFAVTSRLINQNTGRNSGHISIGQTLYFRDRSVTLPGAAARDEDSSALIADINTRMFDNWNIGGDFIWDPNTGDKTEKLTARASYNPAPGKVLNLAYRVRRDTTDIEQADISLHWPVIRNWNIVGRWNYAVPENRSLEIFGGIEYEDCCWGARAVARRFLTDTDGDFETGMFLQIELKGLAGIGKKTVDFLQQQIPGYHSEF